MHDINTAIQQVDKIFADIVGLLDQLTYDSNDEQRDLTDEEVTLSVAYDDAIVKGEEFRLALLKIKDTTADQPK